MKVIPRPILLVEDDPNDILLIRRAFRKANVVAPLHVVHHGEAAVAYLEGRGAYADRERYPLPILMLLDLKLPRKSGFDVLTWMRQREGLPAPPVVALTSSGEPTDILRVYDLGACSYYVKPASFPGLLDLVKVLLRDFPALQGLADNRAPAPSTP
jgi:DNA-binding response OmpR family regulator